MPRKPKLEKQTITVVVGGEPITVILHPPGGARKSWYAYWFGLIASKSTGQRHLEDAIRVAESMVRNGGDRPENRDTILTDDEFIEIQKRHFGKKQDARSKARAEKSLAACLEAILAFRSISGLSPITLATPDDCEKFQHAALKLPKNWRSQYPNSKKDVETLSPSTIFKWSVALQAAFERACRNAGKKCVRGVVQEARLLADNPWKRFTWIEGRERPIRQFDGNELLSLLDYFDREWPGVSLAPLMAKVYTWSGCRREEVAGLRWEDLRKISDDEVHFQVIGKWGVVRWFRIPALLFRELMANGANDAHVLSGLPQQIQQFHFGGQRPWLAARVKSEFDPSNASGWFYERIRDWSKGLPSGRAYTHIFRKTTLQYARQGEDVNRQIANDARVSTSVMMTSYVHERDEELRQKSNRTFVRIAASLPPEVALRYGYSETPTEILKRRLRQASEAGDWQQVAEIANQLKNCPGDAT